MLAGVKCLVSQDGSYSKQSTTSDGKTAYQSVPAPLGATIKTLPAQRVLVTVAGTTYFLNANAFYRRVMDGAQETFVVVTPPAGVVFIPALPPNFEVVQLNTMYFAAGGQYYVPYLAADGKELYVLVDRPPTPPAATPAPAPASAPKPTAAPAAPAVAAPAAPVQAVAQRFEVPAGTLLIVRLAFEVNAATAMVGNRVQGYLDQDLTTSDSRMVAPKGARVYGVVTAIEGKKGPVTVTLADLPVGGRIVAIKTQPLSAKGGVIPAQTAQAFTLAAPIRVETMTNVAVR